MSSIRICHLYFNFPHYRLTVNHENIISTVKNWLENIVIDLNLCPFAKRELIKNTIRFQVSDAKNEESLLECLSQQLSLITLDRDIETTLLIHPWVLTHFDDYNQFLNLADELIKEQGLEGVIQVASFHPDYQFAGTSPSDAENYSNKSPYPILHLLREDSLERAIETYPNIDTIPQDNINKLNHLGARTLQHKLKSCIVQAPQTMGKTP